MDGQFFPRVIRFAFFWLRYRTAGKNAQQPACRIQDTVIVMFVAAVMAVKMVSGGMFVLKQVGKQMQPFQERSLESRRQIKEQEAGNQLNFIFPDKRWHMLDMYPLKIEEWNAGGPEYRKKTSSKILIIKILHPRSLLHHSKSPLYFERIP